MCKYRERSTGAIVDGIFIEQAAESIMDAIELLPADIREFPKLDIASDHLLTALKDLSRCGVTLHLRPTFGGKDE